MHVHIIEFPVFELLHFYRYCMTFYSNGGATYMIDYDGEALPKGGTFYRLDVYSKVKISLYRNK